MKIHYKTDGSSVVGLQKVSKKKVSNYGVIKIKKKIENYYSISSLVEKPEIDKAPSDLSIVGRYILNSKIFDQLKKEKKGIGNEIQLTDSLFSLIDEPGLYGVEFQGKRFDCGSKLGFIEANLNFGINDGEIKNNLLQIIKNL